MKSISLLVLCGFIVGCSACMGQTRPAPDTSPMPTAASIAEHSGVEARRLEAERRTGLIFETSRPGRILVDGQAPIVDLPVKDTKALEKAPEKRPESVPTEQGGSDGHDKEHHDLDTEVEAGDEEQVTPDADEKG